MKTKNVSLTIIVLLCSIYMSFGQGYYLPTTIKTPRNISISAQEFYGNDFNAIEKAYWDHEWTKNFNVEILESSTNYYNCHSHAWHIIDGGSIVWINDIDVDKNPIYNVTKYYSGTNATYTQTSSNNREGIKVSYFPKDHSAVTTANPQVFISKWAYGPLVRHQYNQCPYFSGSSIKYYHIPIIGDDLLCNTKSYSTHNISGAYYSWSGNKASFSGSGSTVNATKTSDGSGWIKVNISSPHSGTVVTGIKNTWAGTPTYDYITGPMYTPNNQWAFYTAEPNNLLMGAYYSHTWILNPLNGNVLYPAGRSVDIAFYNSGDYQLIVQGQNACGVGPYRVTGIHVYDSRSLTITPNPASNEATITIESSSGEKNLNETSEWDLEVYNSQQMLVNKMTSIRSNEYRLQTTGWRAGTYIVRVIYGNEILNGKLLIVGH
jgi:hypothetical protein